MNMVKKDNKRKRQKGRGFALIFSVVVVAVVAIVTLALTTLTRKSIELSSAGQESQEAFYAADAGIECALYWDIQERDQEFFRDSSSNSGNITCSDSSVEYFCENDGGERVCGFNLKLSDSEADVVITIKDVNNLATSDTTVEARGYDVLNPDTTASPTERGLQVEY